MGLLLNLTFADEEGRPYKNAAKMAASIAQDDEYTWNGSNWRMLLQAGGYDLDVLKFAPYLDISNEEIDCILGVLDRVLDVLERRLLPACPGGPL